MPKFHVDVWLPIQIEHRAMKMLVATGGNYRLTTHAAQRVAEKRVHLPNAIPLDITSTGVVPTAWLNRNDDAHKTLDASLYSTPDKLR